MCDIKFYMDYSINSITVGRETVPCKLAINNLKVQILVLTLTLSPLSFFEVVGMEGEGG